MTAGAIAPNSLAWNTALERFKSAKTAYQNPVAPRDRVLEQATTDRYIAAEEALLSIHAPTIGAAIEKLTILFGEDTQYDSPESAAKRTLLEDLRGLRIRHELA